MKKRLYFCDQKKDCRTSSICGVDCFMTFDRDHAVAAVDYDYEAHRHTPVDYNEEFRDYLKQLADERGGIL